MAMPAMQFTPEPIRPIRREDNAAVAHIIRTVLTEHGCTGPGFAIHDPEVNCMFETYQLPRSAYFVVEENSVVIGGGGVAPLKGADADVCEMQKFYFLPGARGRGYGKMILDLCLQAAKDFGFKQCYIETLPSMKAATSLYERAGFVQLAAPMGATGHHACDRWYVREL